MVSKVGNNLAMEAISLLQNGAFLLASKYRGGAVHHFVPTQVSLHPMPKARSAGVLNTKNRRDVLSRQERSTTL